MRSIIAALRARKSKLLNNILVDAVEKNARLLQYYFQTIEIVEIRKFRLIARYRLNCSRLVTCIWITN